MKIKNKVGGADGIRTHGLLDAIEARSQLRHGPTGNGNSEKTVASSLRRVKRQTRKTPFEFQLSVSEPTRGGAAGLSYGGNSTVVTCRDC